MEHCPRQWQPRRSMPIHPISQPRRRRFVSWMRPPNSFHAMLPLDRSTIRVVRSTVVRRANVLVQRPIDYRVRRTSPGALLSTLQKEDFGGRQQRHLPGCKGYGDRAFQQRRGCYMSNQNGYDRAANLPPLHDNSHTKPLRQVAQIALTDSERQIETANDKRCTV